MIERDFIKKRMKEFKIQEYISGTLKGIGHSSTEIQKTPLGDKVIIKVSKPGLVVGRKGSNIKKMTKILKSRFNLDNPQIEIIEVENPNLDANVVAERIASSLERFGTGRFKGIGHKALANAISSGALGIEVLISGKIPSSRAKSWRFYQGYLKKCGDVAVKDVKISKVYAQLKTGTVGVKVSIMPPNIVLPDKIEVLEEPVQIVEEVKMSSEEKKIIGMLDKKSAKENKVSENTSEPSEIVEEDSQEHNGKEEKIEKKKQKKVKKEKKSSKKQKESDSEKDSLKGKDEVITE